MSGVLRLEADPGLLTNRRMSVEIAVGIAALTGRRLSMPWADRIGPAPGPQPAHSDERPTVGELWELPADIVADDEWDEMSADPSRIDLSWDFTRCVYLADDRAVPDPGVRQFANGRTRFVRVPDSDARVVSISGRPLSWYSYFFHATGETRRRLLEAIAQVRLRAPFEDLGSRIADDLGTYNVAHIRRTDLVIGIRSYAGISPMRIAETVERRLPTDEPLVIATEADPDSALFDPIRERYRDVTFLTETILGDFGPQFRSLPVTEDNALGAVTQVVAARGREFIGTMGSTFTGLIQRFRAQRDPDLPFLFTADHTPPGPAFDSGEYLDTGPGRYTWNRVGYTTHPAVLSWLREWPEAVRSPDDAPDDAPAGADRRGGTDPAIHAVVCTDMNPLGDWQCRFQEHTWRRAGSPGELVRLVATDGSEEPPGHEHVRVVTTSATNTHPDAPEEYPGFNRLWSLSEWLADERPKGSVLILDADFAFRAPIRTTVERGTIVAQEWFRFGAPPALEFLDSPLAGKGSVAFEPMTWPFVIDAEDLAELMPRWLDLTAQYRRHTGKWESDMLALVVAVAESDLTVRYETLGAWTNWPEEFVAGAPILHYCLPIEARDGARLWFKQDWRPSANVDRRPHDPVIDTRPYERLTLDPNDAKLDYCRDLLHLLDEWVRTQVDDGTPTDADPV
ncbi:MAG: hypothetical protein RIE08_01985 [Acidimicrobiales bacterium]